MPLSEADTRAKLIEPAIQWKEGFARFIENKINRRLGLQGNHHGIEQPFTRVSFYEGGVSFIHILACGNLNCRWISNSCLTDC